MRHVISIAVLIAGLATATPSFALDVGDLPGDSRIKLLPYDEGDVYTITTRYGYQTNIVFSLKEEIETISVGDRSVWQIIPAGNRIFIRPMDEGVTTNMTVLTSKHSYQFDLKSMAADQSEGNIYVAKFVYKDDRKMPPVMAAPPATAPAMAAAPVAGKPMPESAEAAMSEAPATHGMTPLPEDAALSEAPTQYVASPFGVGPSVPEPGKGDKRISPIAHSEAPAAAPAIAHSGMNYNYTYAGADELAPLQVYDDGETTFIKYNTAAQALPEIFLVDAKGNETPASVTVRDNMLEVNKIAGELVLKSQDKAVHIFNETLNPG